MVSVTNLLIIMNIERTELGLWLLVSEPVVRPERKRNKKAKGDSTPLLRLATVEEDWSV